MKNKFKLTCFILFSASISWGALKKGDFAGNGGDLVVCSNGKPFQYKLLDLYEAEVFNPDVEFDFGPEGQSLDGKVGNIISRLSRLDPERADLYSSYYETFMSEVISTNDNLEDVKDSFHLTMPNDCEVKQFAIQLGDSFSIPGKRYLINQQLWDLVDTNTKAALVMHEIIYRDALQSGHRDSISTRAFNALLLSEDFTELSKSEYKSFLKANSLELISKYPGLKIIKDEDTLYHQDGITVLLTKSAEGAYVYLFGEKFDIPAGSEITFRRDARLGHIRLSEARVFEYEGSIVDIKSISYYSDGELGVGISKEGRDKILVGGVTLEGLSNISFYKNLKKVSSVTILSVDSILFDVQGRTTKISGQNLQFHKDGSLKGAFLLEPFSIDFMGKKVSIHFNLRTHPNGQIKRFRLVNPMSIKVGEEYFTGRYVNLADDGTVVSVEE